MYNVIQKLYCKLAFHHLVHYLPLRNKVMKSSLKDQTCMNDCYNKTFFVFKMYNEI